MAKLKSKKTKPGRKSAPRAKAKTKTRAGGARVATAKPAQRTGRPAAAPVVAERDLRHEFVQLVMKLGTDEAQMLLDRVVDVQTPVTAGLR